MLSDPNNLDMLKEALACAERGWPVFPCHEKSNGSRAKAPYTANGFKDATTDPEKIKEWWTKWPEAMIGIPTGPDVGFWILDIDNSNGKDGDATLAKMECENSKLPATPYQKTARGGKHMLFNWVDGIRNRCAFAPGLDVRGDGGYIIVAPSVWHSEGAYEWLDDPADTWLADAPQWLLDAIKKHAIPQTKPAAPYAPKIISGGVDNPYYATALKENANQIATCPPGSQNDTLYQRSVRIGSFVGGGGIDEQYAIDELTRAGMSMGLGDSHDPWSEEVVRDTVYRGIQWGKQSPNVAPDRGVNRPPSVTKPQLKVVGGNEKPAPEPMFSPDFDPEAKWKEQLRYKDDGITLVDKDIGNMRLLMTYHPDFAGHIRLNSFSLDIEMGHVPWKSSAPEPRPIKDEDYTHAREWLQRHGMKPTSSETREALVIAAEMHAHHPVRDYLKSIDWDGKPRIHKWLNSYLGVDDTEYTTVISPKVLIGACARVMNPGCQLDTVLIIEGRQGLRKSSAIQSLFSRKWTNEATDLFKQHNKMVMLMMGSWAIELAEFSAVLNAPDLISKGLITTRVDDVVLPYARSKTKHDRQCIMIGTMNPDESGYLKDTTGNRRYWPVMATEINLQKIEEDRDQLWAEAFYEYTHGGRWWLNDEEDRLAFEAQRKREVTDPWAEILSMKTANMDWIDPIEAMDILEIGMERRDKKMRDRICTALRSVGFVNKVAKEDGKPVRRWWRENSNISKQP